MKIKAISLVIHKKPTRHLLARLSGFLQLLEILRWFDYYWGFASTLVYTF